MFVYGSFAQDADVEQGKSITPDVLWALVAEYKALCVKAEADHDGTEDEMEAFMDRVYKDHDEHIRTVMQLLVDQYNSYHDEDGKVITVEPKEFLEANKYLVLLGEEQLYVIGDVEDDVVRIFHKVNEISSVPGWFARINGDPETGLFAQ